MDAEEGKIRHIPYPTSIPQHQRPTASHRQHLYIIPRDILQAASYIYNRPPARMIHWKKRRVKNETSIAPRQINENLKCQVCSLKNDRKKWSYIQKSRIIFFSDKYKYGSWIWEKSYNKTITPIVRCFFYMIDILNGLKVSKIYPRETK